ncbi:protein of unknown function [Cupriavidus taiwanensis]|uniref:Uncharacterized protein n=1 Tax=Cupriavidus taiwanensis TaxID=164546 RepID=A0A7Z7J4D8_9BURK|nr:hypothetical protein CBM2585_A170013 [Cupriavidus taiwanensis]SOY89462.1 protein of unknown function [Cupriavidus taiwanensis]SOZ03364.1 hypothetical protein CBM2597_A130013 [Cupriavidus taiwanensis]SOZ08857.1 hypothetical protein CBM2595_A90013 [Cupriavidus taiwanensis]SPC07153.1 hypothetical protein CBM2594_A100013 [Cupriavidus taiwanensis]
MPGITTQTRRAGVALFLCYV